VDLAREVHDGPAQALANAIFGVDFVERVLERDPTEARAELARLRSHLQRDLVDVRGYIDQLRPPRLLELGLEGALRELATALATATGIEVETRLVEPDRLDEGARTIALRVAQEALQNVRKHAGARRVTVSSAHDGDAWSLEIADDGSGFDPDEVAGAGSRHYGLGFMRERARLIGGSVTVRSNPGAGTTVRLTIPMREV
jgi:two-component system sensor histidine kinase DegS